jgi:Flp pilus assembly pilin Flp
MKKYLLDDSGQGVAEYALVLALASVTALAAASGLGEKAGDYLSSAAEGLRSPDSDSNAAFHYQN